MSNSIYMYLVTTLFAWTGVCVQEASTCQGVTYDSRILIGPVFSDRKNSHFVYGIAECITLCKRVAHPCRFPYYDTDRNLCYLAGDDIEIKITDNFNAPTQQIVSFRQIATKCKEDGSWSPWSAWGQCSLSCGGGSKSRSRACNDPAPTYGGSECLGGGTETEACNQDSCPLCNAIPKCGYTVKCGDCPGNDMGKIEPSSLDDCSSQCNANSACKGFILYAGATCYMKSVACDNPIHADIYDVFFKKSSGANCK